jgi:transcriptional regulator with XRE-family HTH domain
MTSPLKPLIESLESETEAVAQEQRLDVAHARDLISQGVPERRVAKMLGVSRGLLRRRLAGAAAAEMPPIEPTEDQLAILADLRTFNRNEVKKLVAQSLASKDPTCRTADLGALVALEIKLTALLEGRATDRTEQVTTDRPYRNLPIEKVNQLRKLLKEAEEAEENGVEAEVELPPEQRFRVAG